MNTRILTTFAIALFLAACSGGEGTNPFLKTDAGTEEDGGGDDAGDEECGGCVDGSGTCVDGDRADACGAGGRDCVACLDDQACTQEGVCVDAPDCTPDNCDGCCDEDGTCVTDDDDMACGQGGLGCSACQPGTTCVDGACARACGPDSCSGCCTEEGECLSGETDVSCGMGGLACTDCASIGAECDAGSCVEPTCAATCMGCCNEGECVNPAFDAQCGADGSACVDCGEGRACIDGACAVDPASLWKVFIANGEVATTDPDGGAWDGLNGLPDPFVVTTAIDPSDGEVHSNYTATVDDNLAPTWDEAPITVAARALYDGLTLEFLDEDVVDDDPICTIMVELDEDSTNFNGGIVTSECPDEAASKIRWKLEAQ